MKASVSIPDDLWDKVKTFGDGPSAVVQQALTVFASQLAQPLSHAPSEATRERLRPAIEAQALQVQAEVRELLEAGYERGVQLAAHLDFATLTSLK